jgi:DNA-binding NarL/FixJ family response regulator
MQQETQPETIRILVVDDHPVVRDGLVAMLATQPDFSVVGQAGGGQDALQMASELQPDVICLDLEMPGIDGVQVLEALQSAGDPSRVIVFTAYDTDERIHAALRAGAKGYLLKGAPREELFRAVRVVCQGGSLLEPVVASRLIDQIARGLPSDLPEPLTEREMEVLHLLAQGKTNKEIAAELVVTERTVKFHVSSILRKLNASNRTEAVTLAHQLGLIEI